MKKLHLLSMFWLCAAMCLPLFGQGKENMGGSTALHEARFHVYDYSTRAAIARAGIFDQAGKQIGVTDVRGEIVLRLPASDEDVYTVKAEGYNSMSIRLTYASQTSSDYDIFLPGLKPGEAPKEDNHHTAPAQTQSDMVKVYVKQDPATYKPAKPSGDQGVEFAVQLSATSRPITDKNSLKSWEEIGPVFIHTENGLYKVRIGPFDTQEAAKEALLKVKARGKKDAFIAVQKGIEHHIPFDPETHYNKEADLFEEKEPTPAVTPAVTPSVRVEEDGLVEYKVRLASYLKPGGFNTRDIDQYGPLESYRKGEWTIMMIGGFTTAAEAERVRDLVKAKGFPDASVVIARDGILNLEH